MIVRQPLDNVLGADLTQRIEAKLRQEGYVSSNIHALRQNVSLLSSYASSGYRPPAVKQIVSAWMRDAKTGEDASGCFLVTRKNGFDLHFITGLSRSGFDGSYNLARISFEKITAKNFLAGQTPQSPALTAISITINSGAGFVELAKSLLMRAMPHIPLLRRFAPSSSQKLLEHGKH